jgi:hypothetical protein
MLDVRELLERQARWQKGRASLSWPEKIRMVEAIRESAIQLRASGAKARAGESKTKAATPTGGRESRERTRGVDP